MKRNDEKPDAPKPATPPAEVPRAAFAPPVQNPAVLALLKGLNPSVTPPPTLTAMTDGELSAQYEGGPRHLPAAGDTPAPEAKVVVNAAAPTKKKKEPPDPATLQSTFRNLPQKSRAMPIAVALLLVVGVVLAVVLVRNTKDAESTLPPPGSATAVAAHPLPSPPPATTAAKTAPTAATPAPLPSATPEEGTASAAKPTPQVTAAPPASGKRGDIDPGSSPF